MTGAACRIAVVCTLLWAAALPAAAWGPRTQLAIVTNAGHLLSKESNIPLNRLDRDLRNGALVSMQMVEALYPALAINPVSAIESEMLLLQAAKGGRVDAYFAYRLGVLGKLVAETTSPLRETPLTYRNLYDADADGAIESTPMKPADRRFVQARSYFTRAIAEANQRNDLILKEYKSGVGFRGVAQSSLTLDASRSVNAVADVWHTVLTSGTVSGNVSESQLQSYIVAAYDFYIGRGNTAEIDAAAQRFARLAKITPDMRARIGNMFYDAQMFDAAMTEYRAVLAEAPDRRDVVERISDYYVSVGDEALERGRLETALEAFQQALDANALHPVAEARRLRAAAMITERDARQAADQAALDRAEQVQSLAEQEALRGRYAESIALLREALDSYGEVSDEFPAETQRRMRGASDARYRLQELKQEIMVNAQTYSGSGFGRDARDMSRPGPKNLDNEALRAIVQKSYEDALKDLEQDLAAVAAIE